MVCCSVASAQRVDRLKGFWIRNDIDKLTTKITNGIDTDTGKVLAIHTWITNHIKYDIKKFVTHNYRRDKTQRVLLRRKAICLGYSDLFDDMCQAAGVLSTSVPGYAKTLDKDVTDSFYLDEHIWNAAKVEDGWVLIDNTWDAGYIRWYRKSIETYILNALFINYTRIVYDPKFKFAPHKTYFAKSGLFFSTDHLPNIPIWQLLDTTISIEDFQKDSTSYYFSYKKDKHSSNRNNPSLDIYANLSDENKQIRMGPLANNFNRRNHYLVAGSEFLKGQRLLNSLIENESNDTTALNRVISLCEKSQFHCDSNYLYLKQEYRSLMRNNRIKIQDQKAYNKLYVRNLKDVQRIGKSGRDKMENLARQTKKYYKINDNRISKRVGDSKFERTKFKHRFETISDSIRQVFIVDSLKNVIFQLGEKLRVERGFRTVLKDSILVAFQKQRQYVDMIDGHFFSLVNSRAAGYDDRDYPIVAQKSSFKYIDSLMYIDTVGLADTIKAYIKRIYRTSRSFDRTFRSFNSSCKSLRRMQNSNLEIQSTFRDVKSYYLSEMQETQSWLSTLRIFSNVMRSNFKETAKHAKKKSRKYIAVERTIFKPNSIFKVHYKALSAANKDLNRKASLVKRRGKRNKKKVVKRLNNVST